MRRYICWGVAVLIAGWAGLAQAMIAPQDAKDNRFMVVRSDVRINFTLTQATVMARYRLAPRDKPAPAGAVAIFYPVIKGYPDAKEVTIVYAWLPATAPKGWPRDDQWRTTPARVEPFQGEGKLKSYDRRAVFTVPAPTGPGAAKMSLALTVNYTQALKKGGLLALPLAVGSLWPAPLGPGLIACRVPKGYWLSSSTRSFKRARGGAYRWAIPRGRARDNLGLRLVKGTKKKGRRFYFRWHIHLPRW